MKNNNLSFTKNNNDSKLSKVCPSNIFTNMYKQKEGIIMKKYSKLLNESRSRPKPYITMYNKDNIFKFETNDNFDSFINRNNKQKTPNNNIQRINSLYNELNRKLNSPKEKYITTRNTSPNGGNGDSYCYNVKVNKYKNNSIIINDERDNYSAIKVNSNSNSSSNSKVHYGSNAVQRKDVLIPRSGSIKTINIPKLSSQSSSVNENENVNNNNNNEYFSECVTYRKRNTQQCFDDTETKDDISFTMRTEDDMKNKDTSYREIKTIRILKAPLPDNKHLNNTTTNINNTNTTKTLIRQHSPSTCNKHLFKLKQKLQEIVIKYKAKHNQQPIIQCNCSCHNEMTSLLNELSNIVELN